MKIRDSKIFFKLITNLIALVSLGWSSIVLVDNIREFTLDSLLEIKSEFKDKEFLFTFKELAKF